MIDLHIKYGTQQPAPLDEVTLSPHEVFEALCQYVAARTGGRQVYDIVGHAEVYQLGQRHPWHKFTLALKPESK